MTSSHKNKIGRIVLTLSGQLSGLDCKIIGAHTNGPIRRQTMVVFGNLVKKNIKNIIVKISLQNEVIAFSDNINLPRGLNANTAYSLDFFLQKMPRDGSY